MEEDNSILDVPQDDVIIRETQMMDSLKSFSKNWSFYLCISQMNEAETAHLQINNCKVFIAACILSCKPYIIVLMEENCCIKS